MPQLFANNLSTTVGSSFAAGSATTLVLASGTNVPAVAAPDFMLLTIEEGANRSIVKVTACSAGATSLTVSSTLMEGTNPATYTTAAKVEGRLTRDSIIPKMYYSAGDVIDGSQLSSAIHISPDAPNALNSYYGYNGAASMWINYRGYADGATQFRNLIIGNGKQAAVVTVTGATPKVDIAAATAITGRMDAAQVMATGSGCGMALNSISDGVTCYLSAGVYWTGSAWVIKSGSAKHAVMGFDATNAFVTWYSSNNGTDGGSPSWNVASGVNLWDWTGYWTSGVKIPASVGLEMASGAPGTTTYKLYHVSGALKWNGVAVQTASPRVLDSAASGTISIDASAYDMITTRGASGALAYANPTGSPTQGQKLIIRIKDDGTARSLDFTTGTQWRAMGVALPTTTVLGKTLYLGFLFNSTDTKWDLVASAQEG